MLMKRLVDFFLWNPPSFEHHPLVLNQGGDMITHFPPKHSILA